ncbi:MAG: hypothetical protein J0I91_16595 [Candidatus Accumulibacter sp.]|nr:hypothetical protein [Accumulibacter sp.]
MQKAADRLKSQSQSQLELSLNLCNSWLECCQRLTEINGQSARAFLAHGETDNQSWMRDGGTGLILDASRIIMGHWASTLACSTDFQRKILTDLAKR